MQPRGIRPAPRIELPEDQLALITQVQQRIELVRRLMETVLTPGIDYDTIPGTDKPTLLQPGAQLICMILNARPQIEVQSQRQLDPPFIAHTVITRLVKRDTGEVIGEGVGSANSRERRFTSKRYAGRDPFDLDNTLLKIAAKRSLVHAVLNTTGASRIFSQDMEELEEEKPNRSDLINEIVSMLADPKNRHLVERAKAHLLGHYGVERPQLLSDEKLVEYAEWVRKLVQSQGKQDGGQEQQGLLLK